VNNQILDQDGDGLLTAVELESGLKDLGVSPDNATLFTAWFFKGIRKGKAVEVKKHIQKFLRDDMDEAGELREHLVCLNNFFSKVTVLYQLNMVGEEQVRKVPGEDYTRAYIKYCEPMHKARITRIHETPYEGKHKDPAYDILRTLYELHHLPEPDKRADLIDFHPIHSKDVFEFQERSRPEQVGRIRFGGTRTMAPAQKRPSLWSRG